jgi:protein TonB
MMVGASVIKRTRIHFQLVTIGLAMLFAGSAARSQQSIAGQPIPSSVSILDSTREQDGLSGPVRRVHTEMSKVSINSGNATEEPRMLLEVTTYDPQGKRIWNVYYPVNTGSFKGNQEFTYDEQGHVKEMTLRDDTGRVLSREAYDYEFDKFGNWTKMTSSLVIFEDGKLVHEPFEKTYRAISYYFDDSVAKIVKSSASPTDTSISVTAAVSTEKPKSNNVKPSSGESRDDVKQPPANHQPDAVMAPSDRPKTDIAHAAGAKVATVVEPKGTRGVDVSASAEQAYQVPPAPITQPSLSKPTISGGVVTGKVLSLPKPVYPREAVTRGVFGKVVIEVTVDEQGRVIDARALSGIQLLRTSAIDAARLARFGPTLLSGQPVKATRIISYDFNRP